MFCDGEVAETGNHGSLMKEEGIYYTLVTAQTGGDLQDELEAFAVTPMKVNVFPPNFERQSSRQSGIGHKVVPDRQESQLERQQSVKAGEEKDPEPEKKDLSEKEVNNTCVFKYICRYLCPCLCTGGIIIIIEFFCRSTSPFNPLQFVFKKRLINGFG